MVPRYSVKRPYTVVVAIILVLILGVVSFGKMNTDLLPSMNLPYAIVITTYQGASPETVETVVTRPVEQSMATVTDIENVSSTSSENMSMVVLEFQESTNMDSATIEIREKLDQISGYWEDAVGKPMIMKLNPDMMPIMIAAVEIDGLEATEVTDYVNSHIQAELESVAGVASASTTGTVTERVDVIVRQEKIEQQNEKVMDALDKQFEEKEQELADARQELEEGKQELADGKSELESGQAQLDEGKNALVSGLAQGQQMLADTEAQLDAGKEEIETQLALLDEKQAELDAGRQELENGETQAEQGLEAIEQTRTGLDQILQGISGLENTEAELNANLTQAQEAIALIDQQLAALDQQAALEQQAALQQSGTVQSGAETPAASADAFTDGAEAGTTDVQVDVPADIPQDGIGDVSTDGLRAELEQQKAELTAAVEEIQAGLGEIETNKAALTEQRDAILASLGVTTVEEAQDALSDQSAAIWDGLQEISAGKAQLDEAQAQLDAGRAQLEQAKQQVASGESQLTAGEIQMNTQQILATIDMSVAQAQLYSGNTQMTQGEAQMEEAEAQLEAGEEQLKEAKEQAKDSSNLSNLVTDTLIKGILAGENFSMPAGYIQEEEDEYLVRVGDKITDTDSLEDLVLLDLGLEGLDPIRLTDVADVVKVDDSDEVYARLNGNPGVMLTMEKQTGYSTGDVTDRLLERMDEIEAEQSGVHFSVLMDQGVYIDLVVDSVMDNMIYGAILAVLILLVFLKDIRPTFVIACSIPISVVAAIVLMYFSGITLNVISLSGLALGIGMLVDNSIVVIENIDRLRRLGVPAKKAAVEGAKQVSGAIASSTLTTICVFAPIVFTEGITRQLFVDMGLTIAYSLLASLVVALTLVPMMSAGLLRKSKPKRFPLLDKICNLYGKILGGALHVKFLVILLSFGLLGASACLAVKKGTAFMPEMESTQATLTVIPGEDADFAELTACADQVIESIQDIPDIEEIGAMAGGSGISSMMGGGDSDSVSMYLLLSEEKELTGAELEHEILDRTKDIPCEVAVSTQSMDMSALGGSGVQVRIKGKELDELASIATDVAGIVSSVEGTQNVSDGQEDADQEFRIVVNKEKAMEHQLTVAQVFQAVQEQLAEATSASTLSTAEKDYSIYVRDEADEAFTRDSLKKLTIPVTGTDGETEEIRLSQIAEFVDASGPTSIQRDAQSRYMTVSAEIAEGYNIGLVSAEIEKELESYSLPGGYTVEMVGEDETINDAMEQLMLMLVLALAFMYLIMMAQFQSLLSPFIIMFTVPLAFTGGFLGLLIADMEVSVIAMIGFIMLSGIIVNNGIVLVDYTNQLRMEGMEKRQALIQAGKDRLRPIIMTALTTILGLSTMAAGVGMGGDMVQPMAVVTIGGLLYGTLLTLFVVPCIYDILNRKEYKKDELRLEDDENEEGEPV